MQRWLIIGTVVIVWLLGGLITEKTPPLVVIAFGFLCFFAIAGLIVFLMGRGSGWYALAKKYPERTAYTGRLRKCRTFQMVAIGLDQPFGTRFSGGIVSVGATPDALYISMPAIVRLLFPTVQLPWSAISSARPFEAPGWVAPVQAPGTVFQAEYDPGFRGQFIELETIEPKVCVRLPMYALDDARAYLP